MLSGLDEGRAYRVDPTPLNVQGEIRARLQRRMTYGVFGRMVTYRDQGRIGLDAKNGRPPVLATHRCEIYAQLEDVDVVYLQKCNAIVEACTPKKDTGEPVDDDGWTAEENALFMISEVLSGRVIGESQDDSPPPF
jgi:hypothetical protein